MKGEVFKQTFNIISSDSYKSEPTLVLDVHTALQEGCGIKMPVFADSASSDELKNDFFGAYFSFTKGVTSSAVLKLYKCGVFVKTLNNNNYGVFKPFGFQDDGKKQYIGYDLSWKLILQDIDLGEGEYFIRAMPTTILGGGVNQDSFSFCLNQYTAGRANGTVRIDFFHDGIIGDRDFDKDTKSFQGLNWRNQLRFKRSTILGEEADVEKTQNQFTNGKKINVKLDQFPFYNLLIHRSNYPLLKYIRTEVITADDIYITEYNSRGVLGKFILKNVLFAGDWKPEWNPGLSENASIILKFEQKYNNLRKRFC